MSEVVLTPSSVTRVRRHPERANYRRDTIYGILDEGLICHLGFVAQGRPWVMPAMYARKRDFIYVHGSPSSRMLKTSASGVKICLTVSLLDGLVLARSVFNHSMNYRSVVVSGRAQLVTDVDEKMVAFQALVDQVIKGRWEDARHPTQKELKATKVLRLDLKDASAKVRQGPPLDPSADQVLRIWAGEIPLRVRPDPPIPAPDLPAGIPTPDYAEHYRR